MPQLLLLLALILLIPVGELYLLIQVGSEIGAIPTILLSLLTAVLGVYLVRIQGFAVLSRLAGALDRREPVAAELLEGALLLLAGLFLLVPGFVSDTVGFLLLVPPLRRLVSQAVLGRLAARQTLTPEQDQPSVRHTLEGEFRREDD